MVENKNKTNAWRLTHTSTYNKAKDTVCMVKTWIQYTVWGMSGGEKNMYRYVIQ